MTSLDRAEALTELAEIISDYREGEIDAPTPEHIERWLTQFDEADQAPVLRETLHILRQFYVPKRVVTAFITNLAHNKQLFGDDLTAFWRSVGFLRLQQHSRSQEDLLQLLDEVLNREFGMNTDRQIAQNARYIYIDDAVFSGNQVRWDLTNWINENDVKDCSIVIIVMGYHSSGQWYANKQITKISRPRGIRLTWRRAVQIQNWRNSGNEDRVQVLWPAEISADPFVDQWLEEVPADRAYFSPRPVGAGHANEFFASEDTRHILEQAFLKKGAYIRSLSQNPSNLMRPLGFDPLHGPGFGSMFATYRNCPNNCPLVMWWGDPNAGPPLNQWYPLLPRRVRRDDVGFDWISDEDLDALFQ